MPQTNDDLSIFKQVKLPLDPSVLMRRIITVIYLTLVLSCRASHVQRSHVEVTWADQSSERRDQELLIHNAPRQLGRPASLIKRNYGAEQ